jgi:hypothetical protein
MLALCFLFALLLAACQPEPKPAAQKPVLRDANLALLDRLTPRLGKLTLADTLVDNIRLVLVDSCAESISYGSDGWPKDCGANCAWFYPHPVLLLGHLFSRADISAVLIPLVPKEDPEGAVYPVRFYRLDAREGWRLISTRSVESRVLLQANFLDLNDDGVREMALESFPAMHTDMARLIFTFIPVGDSVHLAGKLFGADYKIDTRRHRIEETVGESNYAENQRLYEWRGSDLVLIRKARLNQLAYNAADASKEPWRLEYRALGPGDSLRTVYKEDYIIGAPRSAAYDRYWENFFQD